jgi:hypothetical protein
VSFDPKEALRLLDTFASVGASRFDITHTNLAGEKRGFRPAQTLEQARTSMPFLVTSAARRQNNVIIRPHASAAATLIQLDDLDTDAVQRVRDVSSLILETSPGNHQAWLAVPDADPDFARRLRKGCGADASASGATRVAGTANFKEKYAPDFPIVRIERAEPGRITTQEQLNALGLVAAAEPEKTRARPFALRVSGERRRRWPNYQTCLEGAPANHGGTGPDVSRADFTWCMTALDWGWSVEETAGRLMEESRKAQENGERYALTTARNAAGAVARRGRGASK